MVDFQYVYGFQYSFKFVLKGPRSVAGCTKLTKLGTQARSRRLWALNHSMLRRLNHSNAMYKQERGLDDSCRQGHDRKDDPVLSVLFENCAMKPSKNCCIKVM